MQRRFAAVLLVLLSAGAFAAPITFDDLDASAGDLSLDALPPYGGVSWSNFYAYTTVPGFPGFNNGIVSGANAAYSGGEVSGPLGVEAVVGAVRTTGLMDFSRGLFGAGYYDGLILRVLGLLDGVTLYSADLLLDTLGATGHTFAFTGINELRFVASANGSTTDPLACGSFNCTQFTVDDLAFTLRDRDGQSVPEPSAALLAATALGALAVSRRRGGPPR